MLGAVRCVMCNVCVCVCHTPQSGPQDEEAYRFHVRVMIPCYKEPLEVVAATVQAARGASLPAYTRRTV